jgi:hypothetical protein
MPGAGPDGAYVFVEGGMTGIPANQLTVTDATPSAIPSPARPTAHSGMREASFTLDEGRVVLQMPDRLSPESFEAFEDWIEFITRQAKRLVRDNPPNSAAGA